jgi:hypothetical protein
MTPTIMQMLEELANVGSRRVAVRLDATLFPEHMIRECPSRYPELAVDGAAQLVVAPAGRQARESLRRFTSDLLAAVRERE